ncbi:hypothetical protein KUG02_11485 [Streptococcus equi subsp. zooepidemicus]|uniref:hypothetical protein n=1 Tax=Streptococcus equi TaxID=1336 RepID=UPI001E53559F|nr:hypothetical protein [Streptococcus equi]MCD3434302.1 hypothetical protein [Streptococcus equi subsp. zooepidemicus]
MADKRKPRGILERRKAVNKATQEAFDNYNPRDAKFATKEAYKKAKENVKAEKKLYRLVKERKTRYRLKQSPEDKNAWKRAKQDKRIAKKVYVKTAQATGGTVLKKFDEGRFVLPSKWSEVTSRTLHFKMTTWEQLWMLGVKSGISTIRKRLPNKQGKQATI